nr:putative reverse transcriptase domain-containing protein [Tanacetum cinerariifolium]
MIGNELISKIVKSLQEERNLRDQTLVIVHSHVKTVSHEVAYEMTWKILKKMMTDKYCPRGKIKKLEIELWNLKVKGIDVGHYKKDFLKLKNNNRGNQAGNNRSTTRAYEVGNARKNPDATVVTGTFLLNNHYASILFDTGADRRFVSTAFSSLIDIVPTALDHDYDVELANGKIIRVNIIIRGCTLNLLNHPFNIDLMPVELDTFDVIICMDWLAKYHAVIVCDEKIVHIPFGNKILFVRGDESNNRNESRLNIISCTKTQKYLLKGCHVFLAHITAKKAEDKSEEKRLEDVPVVRDFPKVFLEDLLGIPPARQVEFQIDLVPSAAPVARAPYQLAPFEMKELSDQLQEISNKGFIRPSSSSWGSPVLFVKKKDRSFWMCVNYQESNNLTRKQEHEEHLKLILEFLKKEEENDSMEKLTRVYLKEVVTRHEIPVLIICDRGVGPFEALYGRKCRSLVCWAEVGDTQLTGLEIIHETTEKIIQIKQRTQAARDQQKSYANVRRKPLEFQVGDKVMLIVSS